jgi:flagellin
MRINHNIQALNAYRNLAANQLSVSKNLERLSSGLRINRAADDAAGLAISEKMRSQIRGLEMAERNALDAISLIQTAEGALGSMHSILQRMRELAIQASNGTNQPDDLKAIQAEIKQLQDELTRIGNHTEYNSKKLLDGSQGAKTTSANLTGGVAVNVSATNKVSIVDGTENKNNQLAVVYNDGLKDHTLLLEIPEKNYDTLVSFTQALNSALVNAAADYDARTGESISDDIANFTFAFSIDPSTEKVTFQLQASASTSNRLTLKYDTALPVELTNALGLTDDITVTGDSSNVVSQNFSDVSKDASGNDFLWNNFNIKIEDGLNPTANQNNELKMTIDGLSITGYVAEGDYTNKADLEKAIKDAIIGIDTTNSAYTTFIDNPNGSNFDSLASDDHVTGGLITAVNALQVSDLEAKGYKGALNDMKAAYLSDLLSKAGKDLEVSFNSENKLTISGPAEMKFDESSQVASLIGMTNVNADIKNSGITIQIGANDGQTFVIDIGDFRANAMGKTEINNQTYYVSDIDVTTVEGAQNAIKILDSAIQQVSSERAKLGAFQNRLEHTINNLKTANENLTSAESRIRDTDMAMEMAEFTKNNILTQAAQAMLAQSNQLPQGILQLLKS